MQIQFGAADSADDDVGAIGRTGEDARGRDREEHSGQDRGTSKNIANRDSGF